MTVYTLFLYIGIVALVLTFSLGLGLSKKREFVRTHLPLWFVQYFVGALLVFSGAVKVVDPLGTAYKMADYFTLLLPVLSFMKPFVVPFGLLMIVLEVVLGINLILGHGKKWTTSLSFLMMLFFTFLTGYNYLTGYIPQDVSPFATEQWVAFNENNIRVSDCGCFGDFMKLLPIETFGKDIILTFMTIFLYIRTESLQYLIPERGKGRLISTSFWTVAITVASLFNFYFGLPWVDFRPFAEGRNIVVEREICALDQPEVLLTYTYKNKKTGEEVKVNNKQMSEETEKYSYLWKTKDADGNKIWETQNDKTEEEVLKKGCDSKVAEMDASKQHSFASQGYSFLVVADDLSKSSKEGFKKIAALSLAAEKQKGIPTHALYYYIKDADSDGDYSDDLEAFRQELGTAFDFTQSDEKLVKTIIRSSPGLLLLHNGTIIKKWHHRQLPGSFEELAEAYIQEPTVDLELELAIQDYMPEGTKHGFFCSVAKVNQGDFGQQELDLVILDGNDALLRPLMDENTDLGVTERKLKVKLSKNPQLVPSNPNLKWVPNGILDQKGQAWEIVSIELK